MAKFKFTKTTIEELRKTYTEAAALGRFSFEYNGKTYLTHEAKHLLEYMDWKLNRKRTRAE